LLEGYDKYSGFGNQFKEILISTFGQQCSYLRYLIFVYTKLNFKVKKVFIKKLNLKY